MSPFLGQQAMPISTNCAVSETCVQFDSSSDISLECRVCRGGTWRGYAEGVHGGGTWRGAQRGAQRWLPLATIDLVDDNREFEV